MGKWRKFLMRVFHRISVLRRLYYLPAELWDRFKGRDIKLIPPRHLRALTGRGPFAEIGREFLGHFIKYGGLEPGDRVLDIGSGAGRMAVALAGYLDGNGSYEGFDILKDLVKWCQAHITARHPKFRFQFANIWNKLYNPHGLVKAAGYKFPYDSESFDFVFLTSVFTHMLPRDMEHYLSEISRVLKPGGTCLATYFFLNVEAQKLMAEGQSRLSFVYKGENYLTVDEKVPEANVAYEENFVRGLFAKHDLRIREPIYYGLWSGRKDYLSYQDIVIAEKLA